MTTQQPLVTISVFSYNQEKYLPKLIDSVLNQTYKNIELFIFDDASTDNTHIMVEQYNDDPRFHFLRNEKNIGSERNYKQASEAGSGKYKMVFGGDDFLHPTYIETTVRYLEEHPKCVLAYTPAIWVDENDQEIKIGEHIGHPKQTRIGGRNEVADLLVFDNYITPCTLIVRSEALKEIDPAVDIKAPAALDWEQYVRLALLNNNFIFIKEPLSYYRIHSEQISQKKFYNSLRPLQAHIYILQKTLKHPKAKELLQDRKEEIIQHLLRRYETYRHLPEAKQYEKEIIKLQNKLDSFARKLPPLSEKPLVSVILTTYNRRELLHDAIESVLAQTYKNFELLIVNDAGEDVSDIVESFNDPRIKLFTHRFNSGLPFARNTALRFIQGEIVCYLDDDDLYKQHHLHTLVQTYKKHNPAVVFTGSLYVDEEIHNGKRTIIKEETPFDNIEYSKERLHIQNFIPVNAWSHRAETIKEVGYFDETLTSMEDWDYLLKLSRKYDFYQVKEITVEVRRRINIADNMLRREQKNFVPIYEKLYERYDNLGNALVQKEREAIIQKLSFKQETSIFNGKLIAYLNHPYAVKKDAHHEQVVIDGLNYLDEYKIVSIWKNDGENFEFDYDIISKVDTIIVHNRGALFHEAVLKLKAFGKKIIFLLDYNPFAVPVKHPSYHYFHSLKGRMEAMLHLGDKIVVTSSTLQKQFDSYETELLEVGVNLELWTQKVKKEEHDKVRIAFIGNEHNIDALATMRPVMNYIKNNLGKKAELKIYGLDVESYKLYPYDDLDPIRVKAPSYHEWIKFLRQQSIDIILLSSTNDKFAKSFNGLEMFEYSLSNIALVGANVEPFNQFIEHGKNGYLCGSSFNDWKTAIDSLLNETQKMIDFSNNAFKKVLENFTVQHNAASWRNILDGVASSDNPIKIDRLEFEALQLKWKKYDIASLEYYPAWLEQKRFRTQDIAIWAKEAEHWKKIPHFTFFISFDGDNERLERTLDSIQKQLYPKKHIVIISQSPLFFDRDDIDVVQTDIGYFNALNALVSENELEWVIPTTCGDIFENDYLAIMTQILQENDELGFIYCDNGHIDDLGVLHDPYFKPDLNIDMLRSFNYIDNTFAIHKVLFDHIGGVDSSLVFNELYDLTLKAVEVLQKDQLFHIDELLWHKYKKNLSTEEKRLERTASKLTVSKHLKRLGIEADVVDGNAEDTLRVLYVHKDEPLVSIIIPTRDRLDLLQRCIDSLIEKTEYKNYELLIIDNQSKEDETIAYFNHLTTTYDFVRIIPYNKEFNYSEANNIGAQEAKGEYLLFLNNDTEITHDNWLRVMLSYTQRDDIAMVGARLLFSDNTIQHAGVNLGINLPASHVFGNEKLYISGYMNRLQIDQNLSAVTGACMLVEKATFDAVGGFNQTDYKIYYSDIDLCLKVCQTDKKIVWTPYATLYHHESKSLKQGTQKELEKRAKIFQKDREVLISKWYNIIQRDPAYNKNLYNVGEMLLLNVEDMPHWNRFTKQTKKVWSIPRGLDGGGEYRVIAPMSALDEASYIQNHISWNYYNFDYVILRHKPDILLLQTPLHDTHIQFLEMVQKRFDGDIIFEVDDLLDNIPKDNPAYANRYPDITKRLKKAIGLSDKLVVSTKPLLDAYSKYAKRSEVIPNYLRKDIWLNLQTKRFVGKKIRVGWAGGAFHHGDLAIIKDVVKQLKDKVEWVFMGLVPEGCQDIVEYHEAVPLREYPAKLATLNLDLAVVPLQLHPFNDAKSNLRLLELGIFGWSVIASDAYPYRNAPVTIVQNTTKAWVDAIEEKIKDKNKLVEEGEKLRKWVLENYILEDHLDEIYQKYTS